MRDRYLVGMLAPSYKQILPEEQDELALAEGSGTEDGASDQSVLNTATLNPSSMGMSFCVDGAVTSLVITASWGRYKRVRSETLTKETGAPELVWKRQQMGGKSHTIALKAGAITPWSPELEEQREVQVQGKIRRSDHDWTITLFLVNGQREPKLRRDEAWLFQPVLTVEAPDQAPVFQRRNSVQHRRLSAEEQTMAMLYRRHASFAIGHGVGIHAETLQEDSTRAIRLSTVVVPSYDVPRTEAPTGIEIPELVGLLLDMKELAACPAAQIAQRLSPLTNAYETWIAEQQSRIADPSEGLNEYRDVAQQTLAECSRTLERIRAGIVLLATNKEALRAFSFMNRAMWQQRIHTLYAEEVRRGRQIILEEKDSSENRSWRPFQLAFILLNLPALTNLHHPDRSADASAIADLLWFPTGGGKTEAYLGLTALYIESRENERRGYNRKEAEKRASRGESDLAPEHQARRVDAIPLLVACGADRTVSETPRCPEVSLHPRMIGMPLAVSARRLYSTIPTRRFSYGRSHDERSCLSGY